VVVATTVILSFIFFWHAAAIVLSDVASAASCAGIAGRAIGKAASWFIPGFMLLAYAVRAYDLEDCRMLEWSAGRPGLRPHRRGIAAPAPRRMAADLRSGEAEGVQAKIREEGGTRLDAAENSGFPASSR
jgi:hypothetical protein